MILSLAIFLMVHSEIAFLSFPAFEVMMMTAVCERGLRCTMIFFLISIPILSNPVARIVEFNRMIFKLKNSPKRSKELQPKIVRFNELFIESFTELNEINNKFVRPFFFLTISINLFSNLVFMVALSRYSFEYFAKCFVCLLVSSQMFMGGSLSFYFARISNKPYD